MPLLPMSERESEFLKELKLSLMRYMIGLVFSIVTLGLTFYFSTTYRLNNLEQQSKKLDVEKADKEIIELKLDNIYQAIESLHEKEVEKPIKK